MARKAGAQVDPETKVVEPEPLPVEDIEIDLEDAPESSETVVDTTPLTKEQAADTVTFPDKSAPPPAEDAEKVALRQRLAEMQRAEELSRQQLEEAQGKQRQ